MYVSVLMPCHSLRTLASCPHAPCSVTVGRREALCIKSTHKEKHMRGNTFIACAATFHTWEKTRANESMLGQSDFCPFASQACSRL